ncbi:hypothetical protein N7466_003322 [Penicillium verhagenii]|uniref:uncharacterized protein n=1 Tax=Penicillium verhagenii TaxID=1562060 RepID=UPI0025453A14|nr:uncharacterized protein N7466_003322 [Penicillium verhagenii]KAJ5936872.1 hypothetical protein N7466_003322 [Penicillium verhagenii]
MEIDKGSGGGQSTPQNQKADSAQLLHENPPPANSTPSSATPSRRRQETRPRSKRLTPNENLALLRHASEHRHLIANEIGNTAYYKAVAAALTDSLRLPTPYNWQTTKAYIQNGMRDRRWQLQRSASVEPTRPGATSEYSQKVERFIDDIIAQFDLIKQRVSSTKEAEDVRVQMMLDAQILGTQSENLAGGSGPAAQESPVDTSPATHVNAAPPAVPPTNHGRKKTLVPHPSQAAPPIYSRPAPASYPQVLQGAPPSRSYLAQASKSHTPLAPNSHASIAQAYPKSSAGQVATPEPGPVVPEIGANLEQTSNLHQLSALVGPVRDLVNAMGKDMNSKVGVDEEIKLIKDDISEIKASIDYLIRTLCLPRCSNCSKESS